jgi:hypothetical protein
VSVHIDKLATRCHVPRRHEALARSADRVARERLARALTELVGPALSRQPAVVRIRRLRVRLVLGAGPMSEDALAAAWARALARSLFEALAHPDGGPVQIVRAASSVEFRARFLLDLITRQTSGRWEYAEFTDLLRLPLAEAALTLLLGAPPALVPTLIALDEAGGLERLLARFDDLDLERLFKAIAETGGAALSATLAVTDLLWVTQQAVAATVGFAPDTRREAMRLFVRTKGGEGRTPRQIFHALLAVTSLLERPDLLEAPWSEMPQLPEEIEQRAGRRLPPPVAALLRELPALVAKSSLRAALHDALDRLRPLVPTAAPAPARMQPPWLSLDSAGLLLLAGIVQRIGWADLRYQSALAPWGEPRFFQDLLAGVGAAILGRDVLSAPELEPAVRVFAGMEGEADMLGIRHTLASTGTAGRRSLLHYLAPGAAAARSGDWPATFDALADRLVGEFASSVPGFREATRPAVVRQFLWTLGRVRVSDEVVSVLLDPSPYHVALHLSGMDDALPSVSWMNGRRLEFKLLGL